LLGVYALMIKGDLPIHAIIVSFGLFIAPRHGLSDPQKLARSGIRQ